MEYILQEIWWKYVIVIGLGQWESKAVAQGEGLFTDSHKSLATCGITITVMSLIIWTKSVAQGEGLFTDSHKSLATCAITITVMNLIIWTIQLFKHPLFSW